MVSIAKRVRHLKELVKIRVGPGAALLPRNVTKIHMSFAVQGSGGHTGARRFWREMLPRLKYYNPAVKMIVSRPQERGGECMMRVYVKRNQTAAPGVSAEAQEAAVRAAFKPVEEGEDFVAEATTPVPPPNRSFDEDVIEVGMLKKDSEHIWSTFTRKIPVVSVENGLGEIETKKELQEGKEERSDQVEEQDHKRWLEMFKREQVKVREMEEKETGQFADMKARLDVDRQTPTQSSLAQ